MGEYATDWPKDPTVRGLGAVGLVVISPHNEVDRLKATLKSFLALGCGKYKHLSSQTLVESVLFPSAAQPAA